MAELFFILLVWMMVGVGMFIYLGVKPTHDILKDLWRVICWPVTLAREDK